MAYGVTTTGFVPKTFEVVVEEIRDALRAAWGNSVDLTADSELGQIVDTFAVKIAELWEVGEAAYAAYDPDQAEGASLDSVMAITGTEREGATKTRVLADVNVDPGTYAIGDLIAAVEGDPTRRFANTVEVVNAGGVAVTVEGVDFEAEETGPVLANADTLTVMASAVSGWNSVTNIADAYSLGSDIELDAPARARREAELGSQGSSNVVSVAADLEAFERDDGVNPILSARVLQNVTLTTDSNGLPGKSFEAIVHGPTATDEEIAQVIFDTAPAGIEPFGEEEVTLTDAQGFEQVIKFTRPTSLRVYVQLTIEVNPLTYAGDAAVQSEIASEDDDYGPGDPLYWTKVIGMPYAVSGVLRVVSFGMSTSGGGPFTQADIEPTIRQYISIDSSDVTVTVA